MVCFSDKFAFIYFDCGVKLFDLPPDAATHRNNIKNALFIIVKFCAKLLKRGVVIC